MPPQHVEPKFEGPYQPREHDGDLSSMYDDDFENDVSTMPVQSSETTTGEADEIPIAHHETLAVNRSKLVLYLSLTVLALTAGGVTFWFVQKGETSVFQHEVCFFENNLLAVLVVRSVPLSPLTRFSCFSVHDV